MPVSVPLRFIPPLDEGIVALRIHEAPTADGPFVQIDRTTQVGTYPDYIDHYTTALATSTTDWFAIQWEDSAGALSDLSSPVQGGTQTLVNMLTERAKLRDSTVNEKVVAEEAEAVIQEFFGVDPYTVVPSTVTYSQLSGLTLLTLARTYIMSLYSTTQANKFTAGLISVDTSQTSAGRSLKDVESLLGMANRLLGRNYSVLMLMEEAQVGGGLKQLANADISRLIVEYD